MKYGEENNKTERKTKKGCGTSVVQKFIWLSTKKNLTSVSMDDFLTVNLTTN